MGLPKSYKTNKKIFEYELKPNFKGFVYLPNFIANLLKHLDKGVLFLYRFENF